jgi:hypothetical protein
MYVTTNMFRIIHTAKSERVPQKDALQGECGGIRKLVIDAITALPQKISVR